MNPVKFTFDKSFDAGAGNRHEEELENLRRDADSREQAAHQKGFAEGHAQALTEIESATVAVLEQIQASATGLFHEFNGIRSQVAAESAQIAHMVGLQLAESLLKSAETAEIEAVMKSVLDDVYEAPQLKVRLNSDVATVVEPRIREMADQAGFEGGMIVAADPSLNPQDIYVEWGDGGIKRDFADIERRIADCVDHFVSSLIGPAANGENDYSED